MRDSDPWITDYWNLMAIEKSWKPWLLRGRMWPLVWLGNDEFFRRTLVVGPIVFPLWRCRCKECRAELADLRARVDTDPT